MAGTEVGTAWVTIVPSAKGFARQLQKDITKEFAGSKLDRMIADTLGDVRVRVPVDFDVADAKIPVDAAPGAARSLTTDLRRVVNQAVRQVHAEVPTRVDVAGLATEIRNAVDVADNGVTARVPTELTASGLAAELRASVAAAVAGVRAQVPVSFDQQRLRVDLDRAVGSVDVDSNRGERIGVSLATGALSSFGDTLSQGIGVPLQGIASNPILGPIGAVIGAALGVAAVPAIGAAITAGLVGGAGLGAIGLGAFILKENPDVKAAATTLMDTVKATFATAAEPLVQPFVNSLGILQDLTVELGPELRQMFEAIAPAIEPLTRGIAGFIEAALPGILALVQAATPFLMDLESTLPRLGRDIGVFLEVVASGGPQASQFFRDLLHVTGLVVQGFGYGIAIATHLYETVRSVVTGIGELFTNLGGAVQGTLGTVQTALSILGAVVVGDWGAAKEWLDDAIADTGRRWAEMWSSAPKQVRAAVESVVSTAAGLAGRVTRAVGNLSGVLYNAGASLIRGLLSGIRSMFGPLESALGWVTSKIPDWKGPYDKDRTLLEPAGQAIMGSLIRGIHGERSALQAELGSVTSVIAGTPLTRPALPAGGYAAAAVNAGPMVFEFRGAAGDSFLDWMRDNVRVHWGGDPMAALESR